MSNDIKKELKMDSGPLNPELLEIASKELRESPEVKKKAIEELRQKIRDEGTIVLRDDDEFLTIFLRPTKFYPDSAFALIKRCLDFKAKNAQYVHDLTLDKIEPLAKEDLVNVLKDRDQLGRRILLMKVGDIWDPKKVSLDDVFGLIYLFHEFAMLEPKTQVAGVVVMMDFDGLGMKQVTAFTPGFAMRLLEFIQDAMPLRLKNVHIVKQPFIFKMVYQLFKPFIKAKLKSRLFFHGNDMKSLHKFIEPGCLPENYGGTLPTMAYTTHDWMDEFVKNLHVSKEWDTYGYRDASRGM